MTLQEQIESGRTSVRAEAYAMSIGEIANLYANGEIVIRPEFQRFFRWDIAQKSRLIESLLLGIPLPSIFVMQRDDSVWEVIDGLQRLSTILEFMGQLRDEESGELREPSTLKGTEYLPSLAGIVFEGEDDSTSLTSGQRLAFKRAKLDVKILLPESDEVAKYELFDRLNTGGSAPTSQEVRNAQLLMRDASMFKWLTDLRDDPHFQNIVGISDRRYDEQYDLELVCRVIAINNSSEGQLKELGNMDQFLTRKIFGFVSDTNFDRDEQAAKFKEVARLISEAAGDAAFRRYDALKSRFVGAFSVSSFEAVTSGVWTNLDYWQTRSPADLLARIQTLWTTDFVKRSGSGIPASSRVPRVTPLAQKLFSATP